MNVGTQCLPVQEVVVAVIRVSLLAVTSCDLLNKRVTNVCLCNSPPTTSAESDLDIILCSSVGGVVAIHEAQKVMANKVKIKSKNNKTKTHSLLLWCLSSALSELEDHACKHVRTHACTFARTQQQRYVQMSKIRLVLVCLWLVLLCKQNNTTC